MKLTNILYLSAAILVAVGCKPEIEIPAPVSGSADFSNYVAVGSAHTAGYSDRAVSSYSQANSLPMQIASQFNEVAMTNLTQPDMPGNGSGPLYLHALNTSTSPPLVDIRNLDPDPNWTKPVPGAYNNLGIPGLRVADVSFPGYAAANPYFNRIATSPTQSYLDAIAANAPTFFTCWLGIDDVLGYASSGGAAGINGAPGTGLGGLTPLSVFEANYQSVINALTAGGAKGIVGTIPDITLTPYFTFLNINILGLIQSGGLALPVFDVQTAAFLNFVYQLAGYVNSGGGNVFVGGLNFPAIQKGSDGITVRRAVINQDGSGDMLLLPFGGKIGDFTSKGLGFIDQSDPAKLQILQNSALLAGTAQALGAAAAAAGAEAQALGAQSQAAAAEAQSLSQAAADSAAAGNQDAADSLAALALIKQQEAQDLGAQALAKAQQAQQLEAQALDTYAQFQATLPQAVPAAKAIANPILTVDVLDIDEQSVLDERRDDFNDFIRSVASGNANIGLFESDELFMQLQNGIFVDGVTVSTQFLTGGAISLDGIHPTPRGYSMVANRIIEIINNDFNATVPPVVVNNYDGVLLP